MARAPGDNTRGVMLTADTARRVAKAVQAYEQGRTNVKAKPLRTASDDGASPIRWGIFYGSWPKDTDAAVELIYQNSCEDFGSGSNDGSGSSAPQTVTAWNRLFDIPANAKVAVAEAENGCWYVVAVGCGDEESSGSDTGSGSGSGECNCLAIGGQDLTTVPNYDPDGTQVLGHENGCLKWFDTTDCGSGSS